jgi:hypothetical protein
MRVKQHLSLAAILEIDSASPYNLLPRILPTRPAELQEYGIFRDTGRGRWEKSPAGALAHGRAEVEQEVEPLSYASMVNTGLRAPPATAVPLAKDARKHGH